MGDDCPHQTTVFRWYREFRGGDFSTNDRPRSGRPSDVVTPKVINKGSNLITENRRILYRQIKETLAISAPSVHKILHEHLKVRKSGLVQKMLKDYANRAPRYLNNFVTGDETWLYYYNVRSKRKNQVWLFENEEAPTEVRKSRSIRKKMIVVFFTVTGILKRIVLDSQPTVTASWYLNKCLTQVVEQLKKLRSRSRMDTWHFHHDNARPHAARLTEEFLENAGLKLLAYLSLSTSERQIKRPQVSRPRGTFSSVGPDMSRAFRIKTAGHF
ncbi:hypothetical protein ILUMI_25631 [Ignelater luminosus]|uniref:Transposase n=1 Tax=Ignelater luminosus TaxID=2038154 RepID=A0A8K0FZV7_IGNLU|nr:hypothetical protein ILUMI_25631 [Ignelater luminosus]